MNEIKALVESSADLQRLLSTSDSHGNLIAFMLWTSVSDYAKTLGLVEDVTTAHGRWQRLTVKGLSIKFNILPNGQAHPTAAESNGGACGKGSNGK